jgi:lysozyme
VIPKSRPQQKRDQTLAQLKAANVSDPVCLVGIRGYYRDSMGAKGKQDRGIYDDAVILISPNVHAAFNASVDPDRRGKNPKVGKGYASLKPGVWRYKLGLHGVRRGNPYKALVQAGPVTVLRDGGDEETGYFGINVHRGGPVTRGPGSEGCTVLPPGTQWNAFISLVESEMKRNNAKTVSYVLTHPRKDIA